METARQQVEIGDTGVAPGAEHFMRQVRRRTRKKFTSEEKIRIILEGMKLEVPTVDLCRRENISTALYCSWLKDFMEAGKAGLARHKALAEYLLHIKSTQLSRA